MSNGLMQLSDLERKLIEAMRERCKLMRTAATAETDAARLAATNAYAALGIEVMNLERQILQRDWEAFLAQEGARRD